MGAKRRRVGAASATVSAGAVAFLAFGTGPAAAQTLSAPAQPAQAGTDCRLGTLLCGILGGAGSTPSTPPAPGGGGTTAPKPKTTAAPKAPARPKPAPAPARHSGSTGGTAPRSAVRPPAGTVGGGAAMPVPLDRPTPVLPDVTAQDPVVFPEPSQPAGQPARARLVAAGDEQSGTIPPLLVATASGLAGAVAALNMSMLKRRRRTR